MSIYAEIADPAGPIWLQSEYRHKPLIKMVPGTRWDTTYKQWRLSLSWASCKALRGVLSDELTVGPELSAWAGRLIAEKLQPCTELRSATDLSADSPHYSHTAGHYGLYDGLYDFQRAGVTFLTTAERALLCDEMGTGKTVQLATAIRHLHAQGRNPWPVLIVAPKSVISTWERELATWCPEARVATAEGSAAQRRDAIRSNAHVVLINWANVKKHSRLAAYGSTRLSDAEKEPKELNEIAWRTVVLDEAHRAKNPKSKQTRAMWWLAREAEFRFALTGTPIANTPDDLWSLLHFIDDHQFPARTAFVERYCLTAWNPYSGGIDVIGIDPNREDEFNSVIDPMMRRMPKALVLPQLPPKVRVRRETPMGPKQRKVYDEMFYTSMAQLDTTAGSQDWTTSTLPVTTKLRLIQFSSSSVKLDNDQVRLTLPSNKVQELVDVMGEVQGSPIAAFAESRQLIDLATDALADEGYRVAKIVGGMSNHDRTVAVDQFQSGQLDAILLTIGAGGEGITLTRASHAVFLQRSWSMIGNLQAEDRVHRIGSEVHSSITIIDLVTPGTVEEDQIQVVSAKIQRLEQIVRDRQTLIEAAANGNQDAQAKLDALNQEESAIMADSAPLQEAA